jgi:hypothetical protein
MIDYLAGRQIAGLGPDKAELNEKLRGGHAAAR